MRLGEYLQIGEKLKATRKKNNLSQRKMAEKLGLSFSTYSNYENGYSEPQVETIEKFCQILNISVTELLELNISSNKKIEIRTFADFLRAIIELDRLGVPINSDVEYIKDNNELRALLNIEIINPQIATFIPDWKKTNDELRKGLIDEDEYEMWLEDTLKLFSVPISDYIIPEQNNKK